MNRSESKHDDEQDDTHGTCASDQVVAYSCVVDVERDNVDRRPWSSGLSKEILRTEGLQALKHRHNRDKCNRRTQQWEGYSSKALPPAGAINSGCLIDTRWNRGETRDEDDDEVADILPEIN